MANTLDKIKLSGVTYDLIDSSAIHSLDGYWTSGQTSEAITAATNALAESIAEQGYQTSGDVQNAISGKADTSAVTEAISAATSGKVDTTAYTAYTAATETTLGNKADTSAVTESIGEAVSGYADSVKYNSSTKYVEFYHNGTGGTKVFEYDASPFLIDGMVQNVEIKDVTISGESVTCLVISFNTDAGKQDINIPLTEIFDPSNYYTKTETDGEISAATSGKVDTSTFETYSGSVETSLGGKQDTLTAGDGIDITNNTISVTGAPLTMDDTVTSDSSNPVKSSGIHNFVTGETATKQDTLISGTNIKTINNTSILGSGDIATLQVEVSGTTLIFS